MSKREEQIRSKAKELGQKYFPDEANVFWKRGNLEAQCVESACVAMAEWVDRHPHWIPVEEVPFPPKKNKWDKKVEVLVYGLWMGRPTMLFGTYHYDTNEWGANGLMSDITHWMPIVPPRKEDKK